MKKEIVVIGAGASGLMSAISAAENETCRVTILEGGKKPGTKLLRTGNGRCNYTNLGDPAGRYQGQNPEFANRVLSKFGARDTIRFFKQIGIYPYERDGWVYPRSEQASAVVDCLLAECKRLGIRMKLNETVTDVVKKHDRFEVKTRTWHYDADAVIFSGGTAASLNDKDVFPAVKLPVQLKASPLHPALTYLEGGTAEERKAWTGVRVHAAVSVTGSGLRNEEKRSGQIQFTKNGISGIEVMNLSSLVWTALHNRKKGRDDVSLFIDFLPELSEEDVSEFLKQGREKEGEPMLEGLIPKKLVPLILKKANDSKGEASPESLAAALKEYRIKITGTGPASASQVLGGGIRTEEVNPDTMMVRACPGLFLTGEILDIDGECGGWNLQFAWATGALAGKAAFQFSGVQHL